MNHLSTNLAVLRNEIHQIATTRASVTTPVAKVKASAGVGFTVADLLDLDSREDGRYARVTVVNPTAVRADIADLRRDASPVVKRMFASFLRALTEAEAIADTSHVANIASQMEGVLVTTSRTIAGRPLASCGVDALVSANNDIIQYLSGALSTSVVVGHNIGYNGGTFAHNIGALGLEVSTRSRFKSDDQGGIRHSFGHSISIHNSNATSRFMNLMYNHFRRGDIASNLMVERFIANMEGWKNHLERFLEATLAEIDREIDFRVVEASDAGLNLVVTKTPINVS